jgi:predicted secreted protein
MAYNTVPYHGKVSRIEKNNVAMDFTDGWILNVTVDMATFQRQGQNWKGKLPGQAGWNGSFSGQVVLGNTEQKVFVDNIISATPGVKITDVKLLLDTSTNAFIGDIYIMSFSISSPVGDVVKYTFNFEGDEDVSLSDAA